MVWSTQKFWNPILADNRVLWAISLAIKIHNMNFNEHRAFPMHHLSIEPPVLGHFLCSWYSSIAKTFFWAAFQLHVSVLWLFLLCIYFSRKKKIMGSNGSVHVLDLFLWFSLYFQVTITKGSQDRNLTQSKPHGGMLLAVVLSAILLVLNWFVVSSCFPKRRGCWASH